MRPKVSFQRSLSFSFLSFIVFYENYISLAAAAPASDTTFPPTEIYSETSSETPTTLSSLPAATTTEKPSNSDQSSLTTNVEGKPINGSENNATKANYNGPTGFMTEYKPVSFDSPEDIKTQQEWGGNCTLAHWDDCKHLSTWFGKYFDPKDEEIKEYSIDCKIEPVVCLKNSWTVTRCNLLCMSRCNREISYRYEKYVIHNGECKAHAHG